MSVNIKQIRLFKFSNSITSVWCAKACTKPQRQLTSWYWRARGRKLAGRQTDRRSVDPVHITLAPQISKAFIFSIQFSIWKVTTRPDYDWPRQDTTCRPILCSIPKTSTTEHTCLSNKIHFMKSFKIEIYLALMIRKFELSCSYSRKIVTIIAVQQPNITILSLIIVILK